MASLWIGSGLGWQKSYLETQQGQDHLLLAALAAVLPFWFATTNDIPFYLDQNLSVVFKQKRAVLALF